ncbi:MAG: DNA-directed RNA polymerase subunit beta' [Candidatus Bipolaricaulota bacterium]|nr:DNA-directed RNA polymerase subunit beta' [Candidatus Bipolaricaulota bacterium]MCS7275306.1 DNA-directed RNA polymerase subunit beta' [Candidatus Bipolaricaulota bacterium]MDW8110314.1 DNA-directed RNA polymerase subunit beta' [Candidatus Bipolaricaulota bacterium]MDW8328790.1 DNA-directed RNA polymerase subunit beta' [Candidatus Bipolaricaulota bacterium]
MYSGDDIAKLRIGLASPEEIRSWSRGEVTESETINYRTHKPERGGLFAEEIFGPENDFECACGKYRGRKYEGITCEKCGVLVTSSDVRRSNMGHIELASPVVHFWYLKGISSPLSTLLGIKRATLKKIAYYETTPIEEEIYLVTQSDRSDFAEGDLIYGSQLQILGEKRRFTAERLYELEADYEVRAEGAGKVSFEKTKLGNGEEIKLIKLSESTRAFPVPPDAELLVSSGERVEPGQPLAKLYRENPLSETKFNFLKTVYPDLKGRKLTEQVDSLIYLVTQVKGNQVPLKVGDRLWELEKKAYEKLYPGQFEAETGAAGIKGVLANLDLAALEEELRQQIAQEPTEGRRKRLLKRLEIVQQIQRSGNKPEHMVLEVIPVLPPELRPIVLLEGGKFATTDLNDLYRRIINRNNRLKKLLEIDAPEVILRNERRMLQEAVDALIHNEKKDSPILGRDNRPLKSLSERIQGKHGRLRRNLLGKRVDYSGRAVIVVNPKLKLHQCGIPKKMALELFKPFVLAHLSVGQGVNVISNFDEVKNKALSGEMPEVWDILEQLVKEYPVLLNRAPTLHRLGIQGFEPILVDGEAIQIHPFVCRPYNADFDGDMMAVHLPLSKAAVQETRELMLSTKNILSPANGRPLSVPTQDAIFAYYYLSLLDPDGPGKGKYFASITEAERAYEEKIISLHSPVKIRIDGQVIDTTLGRALLNSVFPKDLRDYNREFDSDAIYNVIMECYFRHGLERTTQLLDDLKELGFAFATRSGLTIAVRDCLIPSQKSEILKEALERVRKVNERYERGLVTDDERRTKVIEIWMETVDRVADVTMQNLAQHRFNPVYMVVDSGARGSKTQVKQLSGMRGPMSDPSGRIIEMPVISNFREGLNVMEYFISTHGGRKGTADTALKTADSGYLTRRLVDATEELIVKMEDCGTTDGVEIDPLYFNKPSEVMETIAERIYGRVAAQDVRFLGELLLPAGEIFDRERAEKLGNLSATLSPQDPKFVEKAIGAKAAEDVRDPKTNYVVVAQDEPITRALAEKIRALGIERVRLRPNIVVRSPMRCAVRRGVCQKCYGLDLSTHRLVELGTAVGIIAAQSIGEPGTQLTMKTFHTGGVAGFDITQGLPRAEELFEARKALRSAQADIAPISGVIVDLKQSPESGRMTVELRGDEKHIRIPTLLCPKINTGAALTADQLLQGRSLRRGCVRIIETEGTRRLYLLDLDENDRVYTLPDGVEPAVKNGQKISQNMLIAGPFHEEAAIAKVDGIVEEVIENEERAIIIKEKGTENRVRHRLPYGARRLVNPGDRVVAGEKLSSKSIPIELRAETSGVAVVTANQIIVYQPEQGKEYPLTEDVTVLRTDGEWVEVGDPLFALTLPSNRVMHIDRVQEISPELTEITFHYEASVELSSPPVVRLGDKVQEGDLLSKGVISPHRLLSIAGVDKTRTYLLAEIHKVYKSQGVDINDKHLELVIRQMLNNVRILDPGDSKFFPNELVILEEFRLENERLLEENKKIRAAREEVLGLTLGAPLTDKKGTVIAPKGSAITSELLRAALRAGVTEITVERGKEKLAQRIAEYKLPSAERVLLRISKSALETKSWLSAASFQRTTTVLAEAALKGKVDYLESLKPCIIVSKLIPAGTGFVKPTEAPKPQPATAS